MALLGHQEGGCDGGGPKGIQGEVASEEAPGGGQCAARPLGWWGLARVVDGVSRMCAVSGLGAAGGGEGARSLREEHGSGGTGRKCMQPPPCPSAPHPHPRAALPSPPHGAVHNPPFRDRFHVVPAAPVGRPHPGIRARRPAPQTSVWGRGGTFFPFVWLFHFVQRHILLKSVFRLK